MQNTTPPPPNQDLPSTTVTYVYGKRRHKAMEVTVRGKQRDDIDPHQMVQVVIMLARQLQAEAENEIADSPDVGSGIV